MTTIREANAVWDGNIESGDGAIRLGAAAQGRFDQQTRYAPDQGHNPETLAAGALAGGYAMSLASHLAEAGYTASRIRVTVRVWLEQNVDGSDFIPTVAINARAHLASIDRDTFLAAAEAARQNGPIARLFAGAEVTLEAATVGG